MPALYHERTFHAGLPTSDLLPITDIAGRRQHVRKVPGAIKCGGLDTTHGTEDHEHACY
jgi:hypothetical protein